LLGKAGYYIMDLSACIVDGTYKAALASANCALSAAQSIVNINALLLPYVVRLGIIAGKRLRGRLLFINNARLQRTGFHQRQSCHIRY